MHQIMKRTILFATLLATALFASCQKDDPQKPSISWPSNEKFAQTELTPKTDGAISLSAPEGFESITLTLNLGVYNILANQYIGTSANKGTANKGAILDVIDDSSAAAFLKELGCSAGSTLRGKTMATINLVDILDKLITGQNIDNNTNFLMDIAITDKAGNSAVKSAKFHFTSAPVLSWEGNSSFDTVDLGTVKPTKIRIQAPGKIAKLQVILDSGVIELANYIKNRTTGGLQTIDLVNDEAIANNFGKWFPSGSSVDGKTDVTLDFGFMYDLRPDLTPGTNVFTIACEDANGKTASTQIKFKK